MQLRTLIGPRAGEILDFCPEAAYAMLADGRAEMTSDDIQRPPMAGPVLFDEFASGGIADAAPVLVGEIVSDFVLPKSVADKLAASVESKPASTRRRRANR